LRLAYVGQSWHAGDRARRGLLFEEH
jgi:hypothetical protein